MDIRLLQGRFFRDEDRAGTAPVAAVNRELAERRFPAQNPVGLRIVVSGVEREIVGVVSDVQQQLVTAPGTTDETVYVPQAQSGVVGTLVLEAAGDPHDLARPIRDEIHRIDVDVALATVLTHEELVDRAFVGIRVFNWVLGGFGVMALLLAAIGTYGVLAYSVSQRRHEIGVRMALGAEPGAVVRMISGQGLRLGAVGLALGLLGTFPLVGVIRSVVSTFASVNPSTIGIIAAVLAGVTVLASWLPARRAAVVDPVKTLKEE
jgi:putative ABC transport system permease protein